MFDAITSEKPKSRLCPSELALAAQHELVGDGPKALFPKCSALSSPSNNCVAVLDSPTALVCLDVTISHHNCAL
ncbi:hypothetical protein ANCDUO_01014 [Ancylostoma duodenale]|uniref:Uncharacterized protein n=1 Tax=Ancylostoma duodenale TaxID=51022 RepID=A0A0C2HGC4_9BILA|nr:hypothetical protein ANCDUO_01014 [Ancylostoma duodenale]